ncbi:putative esterase [Russula earlei]|uniref:Esterase n=1 Tax=Russula earlei TaxID=71964 RepID=A0ACC0TV21_9AGAM|nr:putative esterase [Russula earlei]
MSLFTLFAQTKSTKQTNTIVLVHGAWMDASAWNKVVPILKAQGHEVITVNLPGHGKDNTPYANIQLQTYVDAVKNAIGSGTNITLVGHSMGGIVISEVAEQIPAQIKELVYVGAFIPQNGESLLQLSGADKETHIGKYLRPDQKAGAASIAPEGIKEVFAADAPEAVVNNLVATHKADAFAPLATPVVLTEANFGQVKKAYVYTLNDQAIGYTLQQAMVKHTNVSATYALPSSHSPFFSMPGVLAAIILQEAK